MFKENPILNVFKYTWRYSPNKKMVIVFIALSAMATMVDLMRPIVIGRTFNSVQLSANDPKLLTFLITNFLLLLLITIVNGSLHHGSRLIEMSNAFQVRKSYREDMFAKVLKFPIEWHKNHHSGDTINKINTGSEAIIDFSNSLFVVVHNTVRLAGVIILLSIFDLYASIIALVISVVTLTMLAKFDSRLKKGYTKIYKYENFLASGIHDYVSNILTVVTLRLQSRVLKEIRSRGENAFVPSKQNNLVNELKWFTASLLISIMSVATLITYAYRSYNSKGIILLGTLFILYGLLYELGGTFYEFAYRYGEIVKQYTAIKTAASIEEDYNRIVDRKSYFLPKEWKKIEINGLSFQYSNEDNPEHKRVHLDDVDFKFNRGQRIALVGESGSGKSTLLALLRGLYSPAKASLLVDGNKMPHGLDYLYEHVTLIPQDPEIFNSTIEDNITMETKVEEKDLHDAINLARFGSVVDRLPKGLRTNVLEKGISLSGGEKQRLALARGILAARNSDFLFMDEPTSSVDTHNELQIYENIFAKFSDKTIISSIHRLHLLRMFDLIYYFRDGKIIAHGTLEQLLDHNEVKNLLEKYQVPLQEAKIGEK